MCGTRTGAYAPFWDPTYRTAVPDARADAPIGVITQCAAAGTILVRVCGEVDLLTAPVLRAELDCQLDLPPAVLVVDLTRVTFFGVCGVEVLVAARERACRTATPLRLLYRARAVARPMRMLHLDQMFATYRNLTDALAA